MDSLSLSQQSQYLVSPKAELDRVTRSSDQYSVVFRGWCRYGTNRNAAASAGQVALRRDFPADNNRTDLFGR